MPSKSSNGFQNEFSAALLNPTIEAPADEVSPLGKHAPKRFALYRNNVTVSLIDAMSDGFKTCERFVGEEFFREMARIFVRANPPKNPLLMHYGEGFPEFIENFEHAKPLPYLGDIARVELARREAYFAADADLLSADWATKLPQEMIGGLYLKIHPALHIVPSRFPLFNIWKFGQGEGDKNVGNTPQEVVITRPGFEVKTELAPNGASIFFEKLKDHNLADAAEETILLRRDADIPQLVALALQFTTQYSETPIK